MKIRDMFRDDIDRKINGVVQVEQEKEDVIKQEVKEYVVTTELKKHFTKFFNEYSESFDTPTDNVGVWITGFFGSGKSHFLKMLSYLLENKEIDGRKTVDYFEEKFNDQLSFMNIEKSTQVPTETILFNIDVEGSVQKDDTAVLRVFAKVFYEHLGFYGKDLKLAKFEQYIASQGKMDSFKEAFKRIRGKEWEEVRGTYRFIKKKIIQALVECGAMNEEDATLWFSDKAPFDYSIGQLVEEIKVYVDSKPKGFRLLFMIDEAGQYVGTNQNMLLNLQSLVEKLGSECRGQVWVVATGQEALDEMIKVRTDEFSRIMARFPIRLSLTSSSVGEVIEKRLLTKNEQGDQVLNQVYANNENVLNNLYAFDTEVKDLKGYSSQDEFVRIYPFVPYQFTIMQKVFNEIRKHGHAGKHQSSGERSMLNGFQESAQKIENQNELTLVPLYTFYDTLHSFLDTSVRSVIERADRAAQAGDGLTKEDVDLLKLLYLICYIDDIKSNIENITILMADNITINKMELRQQVKESLDRLQKQNYISRNGDIYKFLTDEQQDIAREIKNTPVDTASVISKVGALIFDDIYTNKKCRYLKYDFDFDKSVDNQIHGSPCGGMKLHFITEAEDMDRLRLITDSKNQEAICSLSTEYSYFENIENALKIDKYVKQKNVSQCPKSIQDIIKEQTMESAHLLKEAKEDISKAIVEGEFFIDGEVVQINGSSPKTKIDKALENLVEHTYSKLDKINYNAQSDADLRNVLNGTTASMDGLENNQEACDEIYRYLEKQAAMHLSVTMADVQNRYHAIPYGWKEIDIAYVVAQLISEQKVMIKHAGQVISSNDYRFIDYLRKKNLIGLTTVSIRESIPTSKLKKVRTFLNEYFNCSNVPSDEDGVIEFINERFSQQKQDIQSMEDKNKDGMHPGMQEIKNAKALIHEVLLEKGENIALVNKICELSDDLLDSKDDLIDVEKFYQNQIKLYDQAITIKKQVEKEKDDLMVMDEVKQAYEQIVEITKISNNFQYKRIPELNKAISIINDIRNAQITKKQEEVKELIEQCRNEVQQEAKGKEKLESILRQAKNTFDQMRTEVDALKDLLALEAKKNAVIGKKDAFIRQMNQALMEKENPVKPIIKKKEAFQVQRQVFFSQANITNEEDIDRYLLKIKNKLMDYIQKDKEVHIK